MKKEILSKNALEVAKSRYFMEGEDWKGCVERVANTIAFAEGSNFSKYRDEFSDMIYNQNFIPGGRILRNSGRTRGSLFNCYHLPCGDSIEEIGQLIKDSLILWSEGGGVGCNFSPLRPKGDPILGKGGVSSGLVSFIEVVDKAGLCIESGGGRRAAGIAHIIVSHPEILEFIDAKLVHGKLSSFNISVMVNDDFLEKVESDDEWEFTFKQKSYGKIPAREIWDKIVSNMVKCAEPGLINWQNFQKNNSYYFMPVTGTNPCLTGETMVAVADGRGEVSIRDLANEGKDVPVYSLNEETKKIEIKMMRHPRITGYKEKIMKVVLDDKSFIRCTENHKFIMKDGTVKKVKELLPNDRLHHMIKYIDYNGHYSLRNSNRNTIVEHRSIYEYNKKKIKKGQVIHHKNENKLDNSLSNLELLNSHIDHLKLHNKIDRRLGELNGRWMGWKFDDIDLELRKLILSKNGEPLFLEDWKEYCNKNKIPYWSSEILNKYSSIDVYIKEVLSEYNLDYSPAMLREYNKFKEIRDNTDLKVVFGKEYGGFRVIKTCEYCNKEFMVIWSLRERSFCSKKCCNKSISRREYFRKKKENVDKIRRDEIINKFKDLKEELHRDPFLYELAEECRSDNIPFVFDKTKPNEYAFSNFKEVKQAVYDDLNYKIIKVEEDGIEDVYNGTVDDNHNFYILTIEKNGKKNYINNLQCGETTLSPYECCDLGSLVLPNFITGTVNTNWKKLETVIKLAVRFLDNIIDCNKYTLNQININAHRSRRIGLGVMGVAEYMFAKGLRYGSEKCVFELERLMKFIRDAAYQASLELAIEKGAFPAFEPVHYGKASFIRKLPANLRMDIKKYGMRNVTTLAMAPTGTISLLADCTSGIEPLFAKAYNRHDRVSDRIYIHPKYEELLKKDSNIPDWFVDAFDLKPQDHFEMQVAAQKYTDGSVSKTINLPSETTPDDLSKLLLEYIHDLKGVTVYRDGSREGQILNKVTKEEALKFLEDKVEISDSLDVSDVKCASGSCEI